MQCLQRFYFIKTVTSYEGSGDAGIVIPISVGAGLKGNERFKSAQLLLFHSVFISYEAYVIFCKMDQAGSCQSLFTVTSLPASSDTFSFYMYC